MGGYARQGGRVHDCAEVAGKGRGDAGADVLQEDRGIGRGKGPRSGQRVADGFVAAKSAVEIASAQAKPRAGRLARGAVEDGADAVEVEGNADFLVQAPPALDVIGEDRLFDPFDYGNLL